MKPIIVETSARHVHVTKETLEKLFGPGAELHPRNKLSQPGQFASEERIDVVGPKGTLKLRILGPIRKDNQVELSMSEARSIGLTPPIRRSGDIKGSCGCKLVGPNGEVDIAEGVIIAKRHVHMLPSDAAEYGVKDDQIVSIKVDSADRSLIFGDVVVRVTDTSALAVHIDTDESNAACAGTSAMGELIR